MSDDHDTANEPEPLWNDAHVAKYLSVSRSHVRRLVSRGMIPSIKIGGALRFHPTVIEQWVLSRVRYPEKGNGDTDDDSR